MDTKEEEIYNWLTTGVQQHVDRIQELFYFDKSSDEFFSVLITDYFLLDENLNISNDVTSSYLPQTLEKLAEKIRRIENKDTDIIALPRAGKPELNQEIEYFLQQIDSFLNIHAIKIKETTIWIPSESGTITLNLTDKKVDAEKQAWWKFW